jgi:hypothetical protein
MPILPTQGQIVAGVLLNKGIFCTCFVFNISAVVEAWWNYINFTSVSLIFFLICGRDFTWCPGPPLVICLCVWTASVEWKVDTSSTCMWMKQSGPESSQMIYFEQSLCEMASAAQLTELLLPWNLPVTLTHDSCAGHCHSYCKSHCACVNRDLHALRCHH